MVEMTYEFTAAYAQASVLACMDAIDTGLIPDAQTARDMLEFKPVEPDRAGNVNRAFMLINMTNEWNTALAYVAENHGVNLNAKLTDTQTAIADAYSTAHNLTERTALVDPFLSPGEILDELANTGLAKYIAERTSIASETIAKALKYGVVALVAISVIAIARKF